MTQTTAQHQSGHQTLNYIKFLASLQKKLPQHWMWIELSGIDSASFPLFYHLSEQLECRGSSSFSCLPCAALSAFARPLHHLEGCRGNEGPALPLPATLKGHGQLSGILLPVEIQQVMVTHEVTLQTHCSLHKKTEATFGIINHPAAPAHYLSIKKSMIHSTTFS